jgi:integrase/recombinase XerC
MELVKVDNANNAVSVTHQLDFGDFFRRWVRFLDVSPLSVRAYTTHVRLFLGWLAGKGITQPTREDIIAYRDSLMVNHRPSSVGCALNSIRLFFEFCEVSGFYRNVAKHVKSPKQDRGFKRDYLTSVQSRELLSTCEEPNNTEQSLRDRAIIAVMITCGLRTVSIVNADIGDIRTVGDCTVLYYLGKGHSEKNVFVKLTAPVEHALRKYLSVRDEVKDNDPLFASVSNRHMGGRLTTKSIRRMVKSRLKNIGIDNRRVSAHSLRHTAATLNLLCGGTLQESSLLLGHASISQTMNYSHNLDRINSKAEQRISDMIFGSASN